MLCTIVVGPSSAPLNVSTVTVTSTTIEVSWSEIPLEYQNGIIRYYIVNITETNTGSEFQATTDDKSVIFNSLHPYYTYSITIAGYTTKVGPYSTPISVTTDEDSMCMLRIVN